MKKILMSLGLVVVTAAIAVGGTYAYFNSQKTVAGNTFATANLTIGDPVNSPVSVPNMAPAVWSSSYAFDLNNTGTITFKYKMSATSTADSDLFNQIWTEVKNSSDEVVYDGLLKDLNVGSDSSLTLASAASTTYNFKFQLVSTAGNEYQGRTATFDVDWLASQVENAGWTE